MVGMTARRMASSTASLRGRPRGFASCTTVTDITSSRLMERPRSVNARAWPWVPLAREPRPEAKVDVLQHRHGDVVMDLTLAVRPRMRAAVLAGPGQIRMEETPRPEPGPGQVRLKLEGCGVCASNLTPWEGPEWMEFPTEPGALGHEGWGVVE